jgi:hypothetical protein
MRDTGDERSLECGFDACPDKPVAHELLKRAP